MKIRTTKSEQGLALIAVVIFITILTIMGISILNVAKTEIVLTQKEVNSKKAFYAAEAGIEYGVARLNKLLRHKGHFINLSPGENIAPAYQIPAPVLEGFTFDVFTMEKAGSVTSKVVESGPYQGLEAYVQEYVITSQVTSNNTDRASARVVQRVEDQMFPLFQFIVFYDQDLEIQPGPPMNIRGRIHSNSDMFLGSNDSLSIDSYLTSAQDIYRYRKELPAAGGGAVEIKDAEGIYRQMNFDSTDADWGNKALETWDGKVQSRDHGINKLNLPIDTEDASIEIIKRGAADDSDALKKARLYWQADLRIIDGIAYDKSDQVVDLTYDKAGQSENPIDMSKSLHNYREAKDVRVTEIDVAKLIESGKFPANGILYVSIHSAGAAEQDGVRLVNGSVLPADGFTLATDNPLYIQGDYNLNKAPASVLCDAINLLSNAWQDDGGWRQASDTEMNTCLLAGHSPTVEQDYGGGLENFPRFLENWSGYTLSWQGSMNSLWYSEIATGNWLYGSPYYTAPNRDWGYESLDVSRLPPGCPSICRTYRSKWTEDPY